MTEREQTIIRVAGLVVHALGFIGVVAGVLTGAGELLLAALLAFAVGGAWGWGMVIAASRRTAQERADARSDAMARERMGHAVGGFTARFDDEPEPVRPTTMLSPPPAGPLA